MSPIEACRPRLERDIADSASPMLLAIGAKALEAVATHYNVPYGTGADAEGRVLVAAIKQQHGAPIKMADGRIVASSLHPRFALRERAYFDIVRQNITRAAAIAARGYKIDWAQPAYKLFPDIDTIEATCARILQHRPQVAFDIETDSASTLTCRVRCVGFCTQLPGETEETVLVVPFAWMDGRDYWPTRELFDRAQAAVRRVLDTCQLIAHNGAFDTGVCQRLGFMSRDPELKPSVMRRWSDCYVDSETEFLTEEGWRKFDEVGALRLGTINQTTQMLEFQAPYSKVAKAFSGVAYQVETLHTRAVVTGNHRIWHQPVRRRVKTDVGSWQFLALTDVLKGPDRANVLRAPAPPSFSESPSNLQYWSTVLTGLFIADGTFTWRKDAPRGIVISQQRRGRASSLLRELAKALPDLYHQSTWEHRDAWRTRPCVEERWAIEDPQKAAQLCALVGRYSRARHLPAGFLSWTPLLRGALLRGLLAGDGSAVGKATKYSTFSRRLRDEVQALALSLGFSATAQRSGRTLIVNIRRDLGNVELLNARLTTQAANASVRAKKVKNSRIVCFSVANETLVTRSRGRPAFYGNTLLGHHDTISNDLPHDLGFVTRQYTEAPLWKKDVDHKAAEGVARDDDLHLYNARDCLATWRIWPKIQADVAAAGAQKQYETDAALAPITREMSALGFPVDEVYRGYLSLEFNKVVDDFREKFQQASGKPSINPRAPQQIGTWLYEDLKLTPPLNPQGYEWEEGQEWSTSTPALLKILDEVGVEQKVRTALEYLMRFRASETIRNRYIDKLGVAFHPDDPILAQAGRAPALGIFEERPALSVAHTSWKIHVVPSGRWSSAPNWQNIPARAFKARDVDPEHRDMLTGEMRTNPKTGKPYPEVVPTNLRRLVVAPPGHVFVGGDFSQIELRLYAVMAQDKLVLQAFREQRRCSVTGKLIKIDPHTLNAATLFAPSASQIMATYDALAAKGAENASEESKAELKYLRTIAKRFVFLEVYGGSEDKLFSVMSAERDKATLEKVFKNLKERQVVEWHQRWHDAHPETKAWQAAKASDVRRYGYVEALLDCRRRWFLNGATKKNAPPNHEIQGTAAAVANDAVIRVVEAIPFRSWSPWTGLCLQVHDQLIAIVPESRADEAQQIVAKALKYNIRGIDIFADVSCSKNWAKQT